jgi:very-short-patch-repair endonuclease
LRLQSGRWIALYRGVYAVAGAPRTWRRDLVAACFAGGSDGAASHRSAAALHALPGGRTDLVEIVGRRWLRCQEQGIVVHESKALDRQDVRDIDGIPVVCAELTLVHLGAVYSKGLVEVAYDAARREQLVSEGSVRRLLHRVGARGRNGVGVLREVVDSRSMLAAIPESVMETRVLRALRAHGLPDPRPQHEIRHDGRFVARVDFAYPEARIALEYDSDLHHGSPEGVRRDTKRRRNLTRAGWKVVGVSSDDVRLGCLDVARTVAELLRGHRRDHSAS